MTPDSATISHPHRSTLPRSHSTPVLGLACLVAAIALGGCNQQSAEPAASKSTSNQTAATTEPTETALNWARSALERNPKYKVLSVDTDKNTIQVRNRTTGTTETFAPGELAAIPIGDLLANTETAASVAAAPTSQATATESEPSSAATSKQATTTSTDGETEPASETAPPIKVERHNGQVRVTGPGISIESQGAQPTSEAATATSRRDEPIVCDGKRMVHIDGRTLDVVGDAITVRGGCELHITNSHIHASGTGLVVLDATVQLSNSDISGDDGSVTLSSAARLIVRNGTFTGLLRRDPRARIQDQGGNTWR